MEDRKKNLIFYLMVCTAFAMQSCGDKVQEFASALVSPPIDEETVNPTPEPPEPIDPHETPPRDREDPRFPKDQIFEISIESLELSSVGVPFYFVSGRNQASLRWIHIEHLHGILPLEYKFDEFEVPEAERMDLRHEKPSQDQVYLEENEAKLIGKEISFLPPERKYWYLKDGKESKTRDIGGSSWIEVPRPHIPRDRGKEANVTFVFKVTETGRIFDNVLIDFPVTFLLSDVEMDQLLDRGELRLIKRISKNQRPNESDCKVVFVIRKKPIPAE